MSNWGLFAAELLEDSYQLLGMAEMGLAPPFFATRSGCTGTPIRVILFQYLLLALLISLDFDSILCIDNFFSAAAAALEFLAILKLRASQPHLPRPYRIPLGTRGLCAFLTLPILCSLAVCYVTLSAALTDALVIAGALLVGLLLYVPFARGWAGSTDTDGHVSMDVAALSRAASEVTHNPATGIRWGGAFSSSSGGHEQLETTDG